MIESSSRVVENIFPQALIERRRIGLGQCGLEIGVEDELPHGQPMGQLWERAGGRLPGLANADDGLVELRREFGNTFELFAGEIALRGVAIQMKRTGIAIQNG